ncbi:MAG: heavy metal-binding domain-containing protein [Nitriliruptorales bacterium]|nr:heavy metal-binding domain-containing protein [Nitriliruptorales bacterium]
MDSPQAGLALAFLLFVVLPVVVYGLLALLGRLRERRHLAELDRRELAAGHVVVTDLRSAGADAAGGTLVMGSTVVASDWGKQFVAQFRKLIGGEIRSYQSLLSRARREARLRMIEAAAGFGSVEIHNVRFETSTIGSQSGANTGMAVVEILCYGTAVRR